MVSQSLLNTAQPGNPDVLIRWAELPLPNGIDVAKKRLDESVARATDPPVKDTR